ncbi:MAG TPA: hypothetical protein VE090_06355 [Methylomirabilota bacterium]|nr:hypothetical protein [Methylomirabilota bacterium]
MPVEFELPPPESPRGSESYKERKDNRVILSVDKFLTQPDALQIIARNTDGSVLPRNGGVRWPHLNALFTPGTPNIAPEIYPTIIKGAGTAQTVYDVSETVVVYERYPENKGKKTVEFVRPGARVSVGQHPGIRLDRVLITPDLLAETTRIVQSTDPNFAKQIEAARLARRRFPPRKS